MLYYPILSYYSLDEWDEKINLVNKKTRWIIPEEVPLPDDYDEE
jgi:hypothetical protein